MACAKYFLSAINLLFWGLGVALIGMGVAIMTKVSAITDMIPPNLKLVPILVIVFGSIVAIIAFAGCCGAIKENKFLLCIYALCMIILAGAQCYLVYEAMSNNPKLVSTLVDAAYKKHEKEFHGLETTFECCGTNGSDTYTTNNIPIPMTCCAKPENNTCIADVYPGCVTRLQEFMDFRIKKVTGYTVIAIIVFEIIAALAAFYMICESGSKDRNYY